MGTAGSAQFHRKDREGSVSRLVVKLEGRVVHNFISKTEGNHVSKNLPFEKIVWVPPSNVILVERVRTGSRC